MPSFLAGAASSSVQKTGSKHNLKASARTKITCALDFCKPE